MRGNKACSWTDEHSTSAGKPRYSCLVCSRTKVRCVVANDPLPPPKKREKTEAEVEEAGPSTAGDADEYVPETDPGPAAGPTLRGMTVLASRMGELLEETRRGNTLREEQIRVLERVATALEWQRVFQSGIFLNFTALTHALAGGHEEGYQVLRAIFEELQGQGVNFG